MKQHSDYILACAASELQPSAIFCFPGLELRHIAIDTMHSGDLGVFQDAIGALFHTEVHNKAWHRSKAVGIVALNQQLNRFYMANRRLTKLTPLFLSQLTASTKTGGSAYPTLRAKAAQTRHVAEFARILAHTHRGDGGRRRPFRFRRDHRLHARSEEHNDLVVAVFENLAMYHRVCSEEPFNRELCRNALMGCLQNMGALHFMYREGVVAEQERAKLPWKLRPKAHMLQHLACDQLDLWGSPSNFWCYGDEDYVGAIKGIAAKTLHPRTLEVRVCEKLMLGVGLGRL